MAHVSFKKSSRVHLSEYAEHHYRWEHIYTCVTGVSLFALRRPRDFTLHTHPEGKHCIYIFFFYPIYYPRTALLALPPSSNSDPGSHSGPSYPLLNTVRAFSFIVRMFQHLPSSTRVELYLPTLLGALSNLLGALSKLYIMKIKIHSSCEIEYLVETQQ